MRMGTSRKEVRRRIRFRVRGKVSGTAQRPRLAVFRSLKHIYVQVIDDEQGRTVAYASSQEKEIRDQQAGGIEMAQKVGALIAKRVKDAGVDAVVFDRGGFLYHGRVKALAEAGRENGLKF